MCALIFNSPSRIRPTTHTPPSTHTQMMQEMMKDPEMLTLMQQPKIQKAIMEITANPMAMMNYQTDPDVMKVQGYTHVLEGR